MLQEKVLFLIIFKMLHKSTDFTGMLQDIFSSYKPFNRSFFHAKIKQFGNLFAPAVCLSKALHFTDVFFYHKIQSAAAVFGLGEYSRAGSKAHFARLLGTLRSMKYRRNITGNN